MEVAHTVVADFDLVDDLDNPPHHAADVSRAGAVGLMLADHHGKLRFVAASNDTGQMLELFQLQNTEASAWTASPLSNPSSIQTGPPP